MDGTRPARGRVLLSVVGALYLAGVWLEGVGSGLPGAVLPRTPLYFLQIAALFPRAAVNVIDYRLEGWVCRERRWRELDPRAYFPLDPDDKENRFQRVMHFLRDNRPTMRALDDFIVAGHAHGAGGGPDGVPNEEPLGGIRVLSLRLPLPEPGARLERTTHRPLTDYPKSERKYFFHTPQSKRAERCGYHDAPAPRDPSTEPEAPEVLAGPHAVTPEPEPSE